LIVQKNISLKLYNTFGIDVNAGFLLSINSAEDLDEIYHSERFSGCRVMVLGGGSNVLFTRGFTGVIAKNEIKGIEVIHEDNDHVIVAVGGGENWHQFVLWSIENNYGGIENLSLIPGTVGAAPMQNIGAYGVEIKDVFHSLEAYQIKTAKTVRFYNEDCKFGYRLSVFKAELKDQYVITKVVFRLNKKLVFNLSYGNLNEKVKELSKGKPSLESVSQAVINIRQSKLPDPVEIGNAGSFFKNPVIEKEHFEALKLEFPEIRGFNQGDFVKVPAGWLIEDAGWKGYRKGKIGVHANQALVLVNYGGGKGKDLLELSSEIMNSIQSKYGIELEREVNVVS